MLIYFLPYLNKLLSIYRVILENYLFDLFKEKDNFLNLSSNV